MALCFPYHHMGPRVLFFFNYRTVERFLPDRFETEKGATISYMFPMLLIGWMDDGCVYVHAHIYKWGEGDTEMTEQA